MPYDALTFDTQIVMTNSFHFDGGYLGQLKQFKEAPTQVLVSTVVYNEILNHLTTKTREAKERLETALKVSADYGIEVRVEWPDPPITDLRETATRRLKSYLEAIGAKNIGFDDLPIRQVMQRYFRSDPPFAPGKKKSEFPDAIALLSLEAWATTNNKRVLAVSGDGDWARFAEKSERIDVIEKLEDALALLQEHNEASVATVHNLLSRIDTNADKDQAEEFKHLLENEIEGASVWADADSAMHAEADQVDLLLQSFSFQRVSDRYRFTVVQAGTATLVARVELSAKVTAQAQFSFSVHDSIDDDYVSLGSAEVERDVDVDVAVLVTFVKDDAFEESGGWRLDELELVEITDPIDFGYVEPDFSGEYEE